MGRSREGAWIEMSDVYPYDRVIIVAPARERGLKLQRLLIVKPVLRRSREGAWIEITVSGGESIAP